MNPAIMTLAADQLCSVSWRSPPRSFVSLMTLYESNYIRLGWLIRDLDALSDRQVSRVADDPDLHLQVTERNPYTLILNLSYRLPSGEEGAELIVPDIEIRIYRDARLAEARDCGRWELAVADGLGASLRGELDRRWARNMLLNKWLEYCVERGHRF